MRHFLVVVAAIILTACESTPTPTIADFEEAEGFGMVVLPAGPSSDDGRSTVTLHRVENGRFAKTAFGETSVGDHVFIIGQSALRSPSFAQQGYVAVMLPAADYVITKSTRTSLYQPFGVGRAKAGPSTVLCFGEAAPKITVESQRVIHLPVTYRNSLTTVAVPVLEDVAPPSFVAALSDAVGIPVELSLPTGLEIVTFDSSDNGILSKNVSCPKGADFSLRQPDQRKAANTLQ